MKAILIESHGGIDRLLCKEVSLPSVAPTHLLIRVKTCGLNHLDLFVREGKLPVQVPLPLIPGVEITGEVARVGESVSSFKVGDRVAALSRIGCGTCEYCFNNEENLCIDSRSLGMSLNGGYAEFVSVPEKNLVLLPPTISYLDASGVPLSGLTAWHMLITRASLKKGETVLVISGGSSIGTFAIQIAKAMGCQVFTTVGSDDKIQKALDLGADAVIHLKKQNLIEEIKKLTQKRGVDVVFEHVGADTWEQSVMSLARNGRLVTCGAHSGSKVSLDLWKLFSKQLSILGSYYGTRAELEALLNFMQSGKVKTAIHAEFSLEQSKEAQSILENRKNFGKVIIKF